MQKIKADLENIRHKATQKDWSSMYSISTEALAHLEAKMKTHVWVPRAGLVLPSEKSDDN